jgi:hypothetical protein
MKAIRATLHIAAALALPVFAAVANEASSAAPLSEDECRAIWNTAAGRSDLGPDGAQPYVDDFASVDGNHDQKISNAEFKAGCAAGLVHKFRPQQ